MITLTLNVPSIAAVLAANYNTLRVSKSNTQTPSGPYTAVAPDIALVAGQAAYTFVDPVGNFGDWYETQFVIMPAGTTSSASAPQPGYLSDVLVAVRDKLGVTVTDVPDATIQQFNYLPAALAKIRVQLPTFDALVAAGGDTSNLCLQALICLTAARLCPRLKGVIMDMEIFKDYRYQRNRQLDWDAAAVTLLAEYDEAISQASGETATLDHLDVPGVLLAGPTRGGKDTSGGLEPFYPAGGVNTPARFDPVTGLPLGGTNA
jgi:hypothetical protein